MTIEGQIVAYCDLLNNQSTGFFTQVHNENDTYSIYYYENVGSYLNTMGAATSPEVKLEKHDYGILLPSKPIAAYCYDFSKNNYNDLMLITSQDDAFNTNLYFQTYDSVFEKRQMIQFSSRPFPLNIADKYVSDLVFLSNNQIVYRENKIIENLDNCINANICFSDQKVLYKLSEYYSFTYFSVPSLVDVNGDCLTEFAVLLQYNGEYEMMFLQKTFNLEYKLTQLLETFLPGLEIVSPPYFADVNANSNLDMIIPTKNKLYVYYSTGQQICPNEKKSSKCRPKSNICYKDAKFSYGAPDYIDSIEIADIQQSNIVVQDWQLQRHPSIFLSTYQGMAEINSTSSSPNEGSSLSIGNDNEYLRLPEFSGFYIIYPLDLAGRGWFIFAFTKENKTEFYYYDKQNKIGFFLKAQILTDRCFDKCDSSDPRRSYSTISPATTIKYLTSDVSKNVKSGIATVNGQPGFIELPYAEFGIATVSQYIDQFAAGSSQKQYQFSGIVPNSNIFVATDKKTWKVVVILENVTQSMISVSVATLIVFAVFLAIWLLAKYCQEKGDKIEVYQMEGYFE